ncbi:MAG: hypothetical protein JWN61_1907 [Pseudonocardiales bacterium]|nr:hypothetical protein [Pseudonocardiales bacterium]
MPDASQGRSVPSDDPSGRRRGRLPGAHPDLPNALIYAFWGLQIAAVMSVILGIIQRTQTDWLRESARKRVEDDPSLKLPTDGDISSFVTSQLVGLVLLGAILGLVALQVLRGRVRARWYVAGIFLLATVGFAIVLPFAYLGIPTALTFLTSDDAPVVMAIPICIAAAATTVAFAMTVTRPARVFFAARKAEDLALVEASGGPARRPGLFGGLRPPMAPETREALEKAGISTGSKRARARTAAASPSGDPKPSLVKGSSRPAAGSKPSLSKSRAPAEAKPDATAAGARKKGTPRSR